MAVSDARGRCGKDSPTCQRRKYPQQIRRVAAVCARACVRACVSRVWVWVCGCECPKVGSVLDKERGKYGRAGGTHGGVEGARARGAV